MRYTNPHTHSRTTTHGPLWQMTGTATELVFVQPQPSAVNATLPASAAERRRSLSIDTSCPRSAQQQTHRCCRSTGQTDRQTDRQTDLRTLNRYIYAGKKVNVAHTRLPSVGYRRLSRIPVLGSQPAGDTHTHTRLTALCPGLPR